MIKLIVADDHAVLREGLCALINSVDDWEVVSEAQDGFEVLEAFKKHQADIVILDLSMPKLGGMETINRLKKMPVPPRILVLSAQEDEATANEVMQAGAHGFLPKKASRDELNFAIQSLLQDQLYLSPSVCSGVLNQNIHGEQGPSPLTVLSSREREVMKLLCEGHTNRKIASMLYISPRTVDSHRANIMHKIGVQSNAELTQLAVRCGLIE